MDNEQFQTCKTISLQLFEARKSKQMSQKDVNLKTGIPIYVLDKLEIGKKQMQLSHLYQLAKIYNKKVQINLVDR